MLGFLVTTLITALSILVVDLVVPGVGYCNFCGCDAGGGFARRCEWVC